MKYLLDTDHISLLLHRDSDEHDRLRSRMEEHSEDDFAFSILSLHEQFMGCHSLISRNQPETILRGYRIMLDLLAVYCGATVLPFDGEALQAFKVLKQQKVRIKVMDLRLAATSLAENLVLLTRNIADFSRVPNLPVEDWTHP